MDPCGDSSSQCPKTNDYQGCPVQPGKALKICSLISVVLSLVFWSLKKNPWIQSVDKMRSFVEMMLVTCQWDKVKNAPLWDGACQLKVSSIDDSGFLPAALTAWSSKGLLLGWGHFAICITSSANVIQDSKTSGDPLSGSKGFETLRLFKFSRLSFSYFVAR